MSSDQKNVVRIAPIVAAPLSKVRQQFNTLVGRLEKERVRLALWHDEAPRLRAAAASELRPVLDTLEAHRDRQLVMFDALWADKRMGKREKEKLSDIICTAALNVMDHGGDVEAAKQLYEKHNVFDFDTEDEEQQAAMRDMFRSVTGMELDDDTDFSSPDTVREAIRMKMEEAEADADAAAAEAHADTAKPAKVSAREARYQAEEAKLKQSVREIFRKLASALHPDRETDPLEHARKTALMQRANVAYAANDLLGLLELQLEVEQIDQRGLDDLGDDRIRQYNRVLDGQIDEIKAQILTLARTISFQVGWDLGDHRTPKAMLRQLRADVIDLMLEAENYASDFVLLADIKAVKAWLKGYEVGDNDPDLGFPPF